MSALLLDEDYYQLLIRERQEIEGYSVLSNRGLIVFKAKAWLDMRVRAEQGEHGLSKKIKKHLNDITRLAGLLHVNDKLSKLDVSESLKNDMKHFIELLSLDVQSIPQNDDILLSKEEVFEILKQFLTT